MQTSKNRLIFHIDMDAFFTSVEQRDNPDYRGKPVIVGARPGHRGVVSAASYEARRFGVHSAMPISEAVRRCPHGVFLTPRMERYVEASVAIMEILSNFSPLIEQISIDEAFLEMSGSRRLYGEPLEIAEKISLEIKSTQQLTASIGIAPNKFLAKIASDMKKPDGITITPFDPGEITSWISKLPVGRIWGVGKKTGEALRRMGIQTTGDLQQLSQKFMEERFGKYGLSLYFLCRGIDEREVETAEKSKSISREHTFPVDCTDFEQWRRVLLSLSQDVGRRARKDGLKGSTVVLTYRRPDFSRHSKRMPLPYPCDLSKIIYEYGFKLLSQTCEPSLRLIGIGICDFDRFHQFDLFYEESAMKSLEKAERAVDEILERFGPDAVSRGSEIVDS